MGSKIKTKGFSLIEILVVIAILAIVAAIGAFSYRDAMRSYRTKHGVEAFYSGFIAAKSRASINNTPVQFQYDSANRNANWSDGTLFYRVNLSQTNIDPGAPAGSVKYYFAPYCVMTNQTNDGSQIVSGADINGDGAITSADDIQVINPDSTPTIIINPNGTFDNLSIGGVAQDAIAFLFQNQSDIDDGYTGLDRNYAVILIRTGLVVKVQRNSDGSWHQM
jgi:prepilin-type N-terminal cleavage/methylation domain-containing protein